MLRDSEYVLELASTANQLFAEGLNDPQAAEIAHKHFGDRSLGGEIIEGVRKRLPRIRRVLSEDYGAETVPLSRTYYTRFRRQPPTTVADARRCLPVGHGVRQEGLYRLSGADDLIWSEWQQLQANTGARKVKHRYDIILGAVASGHLTPTMAAEALAEIAERAQPDDRELAARVLRALPPPEEADTA
jgi:hypothetical protein